MRTISRHVFRAPSGSCKRLARISPSKNSSLERFSLSCPSARRRDPVHHRAPTGSIPQRRSGRQYLAITCIQCFFRIRRAKAYRPASRSINRVRAQTALRVQTHSQSLRCCAAPVRRIRQKTLWPRGSYRMCRFFSSASCFIQQRESAHPHQTGCPCSLSETFPSPRALSGSISRPEYVRTDVRTANQIRNFLFVHHFLYPSLVTISQRCRRMFTLITSPNATRLVKRFDPP